MYKQSPIFIANLGEPTTGDIHNERRILHWGVVANCHDGSSLERNYCHIDEHNECRKWCILRDGTKTDHGLNAAPPQFNEDLSDDCGTIEIGHASEELTHEMMVRKLKKGLKDLNHSHCEDVIRAPLMTLVKEAFSSPLQMENLKKQRK